MGKKPILTVYSNLINFTFFFYSQTPDHPKLYLWSEQGSTRNEEPIQDKLEECKFTKYYFYVKAFWKMYFILNV